MFETVSSQFYGREVEIGRMKEYIQSDDQKPLIIYGEPGCGKTSVVAKVGSCIREWLPDADPVLIVRFIGTTPDSSTLIPLLRSLCAQMRWNLGAPEGEETVPEELNRLFSHLKRQMALATPGRPLVLCLDSLDLLSRVDGAHELLWFPPYLPQHVKIIASTTPKIAIVFDRLRKIVEDEDNFVEIKDLGPELGERVIREWLRASQRCLSSRQEELVRRVLSKRSAAIFVKLVYATVRSWKSYSRAQETLLAGSVAESIGALLERVEAAHGKLLVSHALSYITASRAGLSESELEDLISLDDRVLDDVYQYHLPPVRRIPPLLWTRIRADLPSYLSERDADGVIVIGWYHRQFHKAATERYFKNMNHFHFTHSRSLSIADYLMGLWGGGVGKPFSFTDIQRQRFGIVEKEGLADRKVPLQPNDFLDKDGEWVRGNVRKLNQLPYHLLRAQRHTELYSHCLFNLPFLQSKLHSCPLQAVLADFDDAQQVITNPVGKREMLLVADALRLSASILRKDPNMLPCELVGRLLPLVKEHGHVRSLVGQCHKEGAATSALLPLHHAFHAPGGPLKLSMDEHPFAVFGMELTSKGKMLITVSNLLVMWDTGSGEVARVVKPELEGVMLGLALSPKDAYAAAYTNANTLLIVSLITGEFQSVQPGGLPPERQMAIKGISLTDEELVVWTREGWLVYHLQSASLTATRHVQDGALLFINYVSPETHYWVTWPGGSEDTELLLEAMVDENKLERLKFSSAMLLTRDKTLLYSCSLVSDTTILRYVQRGKEWARDEKFPSVSTGSEERVLWLGMDAEEAELVAMHSYGFHLIPLGEGSVREVRLPEGTRNIALEPMRTTTASCFSTDGTLFAVSVRTAIYVFHRAQGTLIQTLDAHFGRILKLLPLGDFLLSSSIDHSIRQWNLGNIFQKSFPIQRLDKPIEDMDIARDKQRIGVIVTRKYVAIWDLFKVLSREKLATVWEDEVPCRTFLRPALNKGADLVILVSARKGRGEQLDVFHTPTGTPIHKIPMKRKGLVQGVTGMPHNPNQVLVTAAPDSTGTIYDIKNKKVLRVVGPASGGISADGKTALHAPAKGGLYIVDMRKGLGFIKTLIPQKLSGVHQVSASFIPGDRYAVYYHNGEKSLKLFRVKDGKQVGIFHPHAQLKCLQATNDGRRLIIGGEDGSVVVLGINDAEDPDALLFLAAQPSRRGLVEDLGLDPATLPPLLPDPGLPNPRTLHRALNRFKRVSRPDQESSTACTLM